MSSESELSWGEAPVGHEAHIEGLWRSAREGRLSHAFGFFGPRGVGKFLAARWFAMGLLCKGTDGEKPGPPCGRCGPCLRVRAGSHPDLFLLDPIALGLNPIRVQDVVHRDDSERQTIDEFLSLKAAEGGYRVLLLRDFDRANVQAQNALLKSLEEPGSNVIMVLESSAPGRLVGTVKSRVVDVVFDRLSLEQTRQALGLAGFDREMLESYSRICRGAPGRALELSGLCADQMIALIERGLRGEDAVGLVSELVSLEMQLTDKLPAARARTRARSFLDLVLEVAADLVRVAGGVPADSLAHGELATRHLGEQMTNAAHPRSALRRAVDVCLSARQDVDMNLNPDAACERALVALGQAQPLERA